MRNENGINIILADTDAERLRVMHILNVTEAYPLSALPDVVGTGPEAVFYVVGDAPGQLERIVQCLSIRRGVLSIKGKRSFLGFNVDWMSRLLVERDLDNAIKATQPTPQPRTMTVIEGAFERDDPYESLGYCRR